jgi:hypothetical protein
MSKRVLLWVGVLAVLVGFGLAVVRWIEGPGVSLANFQRIDVGMPRSEVRRMLGGQGQRVPFHGTVGVDAEFECWDGDAGEIAVFFDARDRAEKKDWRGKPVLGRLRRWLGL